MNINIIGILKGTSGYANHTRQLASSLFELGHRVFINDREYLKRKDSSEAFCGLHDENNITLFILKPYEWNVAKYSTTKCYGYCIWEGSNIPSLWLKYLSDPFINKIIVPSCHTKQSIICTVNEYLLKERLKKNCKSCDDFVFVKNKLCLVPHGVDLRIFKPISFKREDNIFRFIANKGWCDGLYDRGGIQFLIKAYNEEFKRGEKVELLIKINTEYNRRGWNLSEEISKLKLRENGPEIKFCIEDVSLYKLASLYNYGDVFVSPNMSEGFGLTMAEAMACSLPVITTNYGGQTDFVTGKNGWLIDYNLVDVTWNSEYNGVKWAKPNIIHLKRLLRYAFDHKQEVKIKGIQSRKDIERLTWQNTAKNLEHIFLKY